MDPKEEYLVEMREQIRQGEDALAILDRERHGDPEIERLRMMLDHARWKLDVILVADDSLFGQLRIDFDWTHETLTAAFDANGANPPDVAAALLYR